MIAPNINTFSTLPFDVLYHIQSFLPKNEICKLKFVSQTQHGIVHENIYRSFEKKVKELYPNCNVTPELLLKKVVTILKIKPPKECNEFEWLDSLMIDTEDVLNQKAMQFIAQSKISRLDSFKCYSIFSIVPATFTIENSQPHSFADIRSYFSIEIASKEKPCNYLARSLWQEGLNGIESISKTFLFLGNSRDYLISNINERRDITDENHFPYFSQLILPINDFFNYPDYICIIHDKVNDLTPLRSLSFLTERVTISTPLGNIEVAWYSAVSLWALRLIRT